MKNDFDKIFGGNWPNAEPNISSDCFKYITFPTDKKDMKQNIELFIVKIKCKEKQIEVYFYNKSESEKFIKEASKLMTEKLKKEVEFKIEESVVFDKAEDMIEELSSIF